MILHSKYTDGKIKVELNDVYENKCFIYMNHKLISMELSSFLARFRLCI